MPLERRSILKFVSTAAQELPRGARVLDAGAGDQPYRGLFAHCEYVAADWEGTGYGSDRDVTGPLHDLPVETGSFDAVLCTQVLEHVPNPADALRELHRVLRPGGSLWLTAPFVWPLHEEPYDFFRYTPYGLESLTSAAGFRGIEIEARTGYFGSIAMMLEQIDFAVDGDGSLRWRLLRRLLRAGAAFLPRFDDLDGKRIFPLGYTLRATAKGNE